MRRGLTLYFQLHQPYRVRPYSVFDTATRHDYFKSYQPGAEWDNEAVFKKVSDTSYRPILSLLKKLLYAHQDFKFTLSMSGVFVEQAKTWAPDVLDLIKNLIASGRVEILAESYYHSLAFFYDQDEYKRQVRKHYQLMYEEFGVRPIALRGTELAYNDNFASWAEKQGFKTVLAEGWDPALEWRSPNFVYQAPGTNISLLLKNYRLSDDIAFRFSDKTWSGWPLSAEKYTSWVDHALGDHDTLNLFMDIETFGEHQWADTGIFSFFEKFIEIWSRVFNDNFYTVTEAATTHEPKGTLSIPNTTTWADTSRDLSAWSGNRMQQSALSYIYALADDILSTEDEQLIEDWRKLQTSDHFYYMCTKGYLDGSVHAYFSPYSSPYDAFLYYLNAVRDLRFRLYTYNKGGL